MPTHSSKFDWSPFDRRIAFRRRRFDTPKLIITHDGNVSAAAIEHQQRAKNIDSSPLGRYQSDIPQFIHVQDWRRLGRNQQREERQPRQQKEPLHVSERCDERCSDQYFDFHDEDIKGSPRLSHHRSLFESRVSPISDSRRLNDGLRYTRRTSASPSNKLSNVWIAKCDEAEDVNKRRVTPSPQFSCRQYRYGARRRGTVPSTGLSNRQDTYSQYDPITTCRLLYNQNGDTSQSSTSFPPVHGQWKLPGVNTDDENPVPENSSSSTEQDGKTSTNSIGNEHPIATKSFNIGKHATLISRTANRTNNLGDHSDISYNENSNDMYCEVKYRSRQGTQTTEATSKDSKRSKKWLCDVCKKVRFDTYVEAFRHETECRKNVSLRDDDQDGEKQGEKNDDRSSQMDTEKRAWKREQLKNRLKQIRVSNALGINGGNVATKGRGRSQSSLSSTNSATKWLCSVCKKVSFDRYADACRHEKICKIRMEATADKRDPNDNRGNDESQPSQTERRDPIVSQTSNTGSNDRDVGDTQSKASETSKGEGDGRMKGAIEETGKVFTNQYIVHNNTNTMRDPTQALFYFNEPRCKGNAYDRYIFLANQAEDDEERERYVSLAIQTREEDISSFKREGSNEERYVCLA
mmetsp:Transcript_22963/g.63695  ORF Transcript_22963/g.63695 Transcript_22963/m.63695 type:complete len:634 (+) Transcript_22963:99-2000(+)|eukprot:CAMPEP_0172369946 /NCGR_PEP_ID=MMETSP1060-20121228/35366_1 /TAXON_ID=37318 /ORGANISM="Pseudo-nitzschia pungens, Strain cf. cingulata" /LENGTH=633 /DNA_ID=CAMNT_0013095047 /DNA_START=81 /DNA_END=1982 /DNA_ORIENTATION=+